MSVNCAPNRAEPEVSLSAVLNVVRRALRLDILASALLVLALIGAGAARAASGRAAIAASMAA